MKGVGEMANRTSSRVLLIVAAFVLFLVPVAAIAAGGFTDVDDDSVFKVDIEWLADAGVTKGCNPPTNDEFCPGDNVTREQMAAFMHRLAVNRVVDAKTANHAAEANVAATAGNAANADMLDGLGSSAFLAKTAYDSDKDGVVDSAEVKIRYTSESFTVDMASEVPPVDKIKCVTSSIAFDEATTVVASGGLSLDPIGTSWASFHGYVGYSKDGGSTWTPLNGVGLRGFPPEAIYPAAVPISAADDLGSGTYSLGIMVYGVNHQAAPGTADYDGQCELTVTAYVGQGATTDIVVD